LTEKEGEEGEDDEVGAAGKICQFVHLEGGRDREENELHADGHDRAHGEMILVQNVDRHTVSSTITAGQIISVPEMRVFINCADIN